MNPKLVPSPLPTIADFGVVEAGIKQRETETVSRNFAFSLLVLETVFGLDRPTALEQIVDGGDDRGIDIAYIDHDNKIVNLCSCKAVTSYKNSRKNFPGDEVDKIISFIDDLMMARDELFDTCNIRLQAKVREMWDIFSGDAYAIKVHLFSNQAHFT